MDTLQLRVVMGPDSWGRPEPMAMIYINERSLVDIIREVELPFATREGHPDLAGQYVGLPARFVQAPSRYLLGELDDGPYWDDYGAILLQCECGETGCWPIQARITVTDDTIVWSEFRQPHRWARARPRLRVRGRWPRPLLRVWARARARSWRYSRLHSFVFSRPQYEAALANPEWADE